MTSSRWILGTLAALGLAVLVPTSPASGKDPKPAPTKPGAGKPDAAKPGAAGPAAPVVTGATLEEVEKAMLVKRYEAVIAYAKANPKAADAEAALKRAIDLAEACELWEKTVAHCEEFVAAFAASDDKIEVNLSRAQALGQLARIDDAKKAFQALTKELDASKHGAQTVWTVWQAYAQCLVNNDDVEGAKTVYEEVKKLLDNPQVDKLIEKAVEALAMIGNEPTAFPDTVKDFDGKAFSLADYKGKILLIDFWATWCPPCRAEMPNVAAAYKKWHDKGFEIVGVSLDNAGDDQKVKDFAKKNGMTWRQFYDGGGWVSAVAVAYGVSSIPHTILVGRDGKVVKIGVSGSGLEKTLAKFVK